MEHKVVRIECTGAESISLDELSPFQDDLKSLSKENYDKIKREIVKNGFSEPVSVWKADGKNYILNGHQRVRALVGLRDDGYDVDRIPVSYIEAKTAKEAKRKILGLAGQYGKVEKDELYKFISDYDLEMDEIFEHVRFPEIDDLEFLEEFGDDLPSDGSEDVIPEVAENELGVQLGDIWVLGSHRLMCGDSTDGAVVARLMNGEKADITFTSPPYNAAKESFLNGRVDGFDDKYQNHADNMSDDDYVGLLTKSTALAIENSRYAFINLQLLSHNRLALCEFQYAFRKELKDILIWNKTQCPPNIVKGAFNTRFEFVYAFSKENKTRGFPCSWRGQYPNVIETGSNSTNEFAADHKAGFPIAFPTWLIEKMDFAKLVYEPFCGTGTTMVACEKTNRKCYGMEIDPHYCSVIIKRWQEFTGKKATRCDG